MARGRSCYKTGAGRGVERDTYGKLGQIKRIKKKDRQFLVPMDLGYRGVGRREMNLKKSQRER